MSEAYFFCSVSEKGQRHCNEDAVYPPQGTGITSERIFGVFDGLGGYAFSAEAANILAKIVEETNQGIRGNRDLPLLIEEGQQKIADFARKRPAAREAASTLALLDLRNGTTRAVHIGDSRIYHFRGRRLLFRSLDHSQAEEHKSQGGFGLGARQHVITKAVSAHRETMLGYSVQVLSRAQSGDIFFLCTDGVNEGLDEIYLINLLVNPDLSIQQKAKHIADNCENFSQDNYSFIILEIQL